MATRESRQRKIAGAHVFDSVWHAYRALLAKSEQSFTSTGLGDSDFRILQALFTGGTLPVNVLGEEIHLTTGSITTAIDRLGLKGLVTRKPYLSDRRIRLVELTAKGRRLIEKAHTNYLTDMDRAVARLTREERATLVGLLNRLSSKP